MAKVTEYTYRVAGINKFIHFPIDMLRYDGASPASEIDSAIIERTFEREAIRPGPVTVTVRAHRAPTLGRWDSFGWPVIGEITKEKKEI